MPLYIQMLKKNLRAVVLGTAGLGLLTLAFLSFNGTLQVPWENLLTADFLLYVVVGFLAQVIDGSLGMAYGISSTSFLMSLGVSPASASASVHVAEVFTTGASGLSHLQFRNVNRRLFKALVIPGVLGAIAGAFLLSSFDGDAIKPFVSVYLLVMGLYIIRKAFRKPERKQRTTKLGVLALFGGFVDAVGGGGWGPVVTTTLLGRGRHPRYTIGSVSLTEFFVALAGAGTFTLMMGIQNWLVIAGLIVGGVIAAPFAAYLVTRVKPKPLMVVVGVLIMALSLRTIVLSLL